MTAVYFGFDPPVTWVNSFGTRSNEPLLLVRSRGPSGQPLEWQYWDGKVEAESKWAVRDETYAFTTRLRCAFFLHLISRAASFTIAILIGCAPCGQGRARMPR